MTNFVTSLIRTYVPIIVGGAIGWLVAIGIDLTAHQEALVVATAAFCQGVWYLVARALEQRFPQFGWLLGKPSTPSYSS